MEQQDVRWRQRFQNFDKAFHRLEDAVEIVQKESDNVLLQAGLIQTYEFTFELAWKTMKDFLEEEGFMPLSPKATLRQAFQNGYIKDGDLWLKALNDRNLTTHTYDDALAAEVIKDIQDKYFQLLSDLHVWLKTQ